MLHVRIAGDGRPEFLVEGEPWLRGMGLRIPNGCGWLGDGSGDLTGGSWTSHSGEDAMGCFQRWTRTYALHGSPLTRLAITCWKTSCCVDFELLRPLTPLARSDSMDDPTFLAPAFSVDPDLSYLTLSFGLGSACEPYPGGHWPTPLTGRARDGLPKRAFVPLVLYKQGAALAVAPGDHWLTSPLTGHGSGAARGLHGSVDALPAGWRARTWFTVGHDTHGALSCLGDRLQAGVKERRPSSAHEVNRGLGWWNAYGSHHTELLNPLNARELRRLLASTRAQGVPLHHLGLDLWYPYSRIGQAMAFIPDKSKYPRGLREPTEGLPLVLHLSALSEKNAYSASGSDPGFYETVAEELASHGAIAAWHDWLRTQQHTTDTLRSDPARAESWFAGMARAFGARGLDVILCMQTMGMVLASTQLPAVISARTSTDYLFCQQEALRRAASKGHEDLLEAWVPPAQLRKTNLLLGSVVHALGLTPFHDLFLSRADTRLGGGSPREEAVLRALSCGPVALGDGPGMLDVVLLQSLIGNNGAILRPDHPPIAVDTCLEGDIALFWTRHSQPLATWWYLVALNMADEPISLSARPPEDGEFFSWDGLTGSPITEGHTQLNAGGLAYRVFAPMRDGLAPLGMHDKFVPAAHGTWHAEADGGWLIRSEEHSTLAVYAPRGARVESLVGGSPAVDHRGAIMLCALKAREVVRLRPGNGRFSGGVST